MHRTPVTHGPQPNGDEQLTFGPAKYIGNFHKTLCHNPYGEVIEADYDTFRKIALQSDAAHHDFENTPPGNLVGPDQTPIVATPFPTHVAKLVDPQCGRATDTEGPDPLHMEMQPAPQVLSQSTAAEMTELYWMALLRDEAFDTWGGLADIPAAIADLKTAFGKGLADHSDVGRLHLGVDLPASGGALDLNPKTLFRAGLLNEDKGPFVSQFLLQDFNYGAQLISQTIVPYKSVRNYQTNHPDWLLAQNTGYDKFGKDYGTDNFWASSPGDYEPPQGMPPQPPRVRIRNMRDLARFVNRDALHQAYFNAALQLLNWGMACPLDAGNPYAKKYVRQGGFGTLGGPNLLALVSEVASRALKVVWRQKWLVHRRLRPEAYGGLMQMQANGYKGVTRDYGLPDWVFKTKAAKRVDKANGNFFLPLAYSAGSPAHPSYGAGHACVADACVTILKAWFADTNLRTAINTAMMAGKDPAPPLSIVQPGNGTKADGTLADYPTTSADIDEMTLHGELNKLAANVALGRSMGGVHWRSDNTRSLRLGERVATIILRRQLPTFAERPLELCYTNFDRDEVTIDSSGEVNVKGDPELTRFYSHF